MHSVARHGDGSSSRSPFASEGPARGLVAAALLGVLALPACSAETVGPSGVERTERAEAPFELRLRSDHMDESNCTVRVTATAEGGGNTAHAVWGELEGRSYDFDTYELLRSRTQPLHPDVFEAPWIRTGQTQWGQIDLEWFRRDADEPVLVELEFHARLHRAGESDPGEPQVTQLTLSCR